MGNLRQNNKVDTEKQDNTAIPDNKRAAERVAKTCYIEGQKLLHHTFFLAMYLNSFLIFSFLESVIGLPLSSSSIANSYLSVMLINHSVLFLR